MSDTEQETHVARAVETGIRLGAIALLAIWVFDIIQPFVSPALWGIIIAVAGYPAYRRLVGWCGGREKLAAVIFSLLGVLLLVTPSVMLTRALANGVQLITHLGGYGGSSTRMELAAASKQCATGKIKGAACVNGRTLFLPSTESCLQL